MLSSQHKYVERRINVYASVAASRLAGGHTTTKHCQIEVVKSISTFKQKGASDASAFYLPPGKEPSLSARWSERTIETIWPNKLAGNYNKALMVL